MFDSLLQQIYKKIATIKDSGVQKKVKAKLTESLLSNKVYKHQLENITIFTEAKDKVAAKKRIDERNNSFKQNNKVCCCQVGKENQKLAEFYNINIKGLKKNKLDEAIEFKSEKKPVNTKKSIIKEKFQSIANRGDKKDLTTQLSIIQFLSSGLKESTDKKFIFTSLSKLRTLRESKNPKSLFEATNKTYQLRLLIEKLIKEYQKIDTDTEDKSTGKKSKLTDLTYIKDFWVEFPYNSLDPEKLVISFKIPVYPHGAHLSDLVQEVRGIKKSIDKLERPFLNTIVYGTEFEGLFNPVGTIWDSSIRETLIKPGSALSYDVDIYLNTSDNSTASAGDYTKAIHEMFKQFEVMLRDTVGEVLDRASQKAALSQSKSLGSRKSKYGERKDDDKQLTNDLTDDFGGAF